MEKNSAFPARYETISRSALTDSEALVIGRLLSQHFEIGARIHANWLFPGSGEDHVETIEDWACRHLLECLASKGYLRRVRIIGEPMHTWPYEMTQEVIDAYRAWYDQRGHMAEDGNALLP